MDLNKISIVVFCSLILISGCTILETTPIYTEKEPKGLDPRVTKAEPYLSEVVYDDIELRSFASLIAGDCSSGNKECQINSIYRYIVTDFKYYSDTRARESIQSPYDTIQVKGGDCEDLSIVLNSLLENLGVKTYLVLTDSHAYSLACGVDISRLQNEIVKSFNREENVVDETISINARSAKLFGGSGDKMDYPIEFKYSINSDQSLNMHVVPSSDALGLWSKGDSYSYYPSCSKDSIFRASSSCNSDTMLGLMLINENYESARVDIQIDVKYIVLDLDKLSTKYYNIDGETCVVLDATLGEYGYPGYDVKIQGDKVAIDQLTKEVINLR